MFPRLIKVSLILSLGCTCLVSAAPVDRVQQHRQQRRQGIPAIGDGPAVATDGSTIVEDEVVIKYVYTISTLFHVGLILC